MYELKKNGKVFTSKSVGTGPSYEKRIYRAAVSQRLRNTGLGNERQGRLRAVRNGTIGQTECYWHWLHSHCRNASDKVLLILR